ncbi:hypothetical protein CHUAL_009245 [Chamberlinius hualienensis]
MPSIFGSEKAEDAICIRQAQEAFTSPGIMQDNAYIEANFSFLVESITTLETQGLPLCTAVQIVHEAKVALHSISEPMGTKLFKKLESVLVKNPGFKCMSNIASILNGDRLTDVNLSTNDIYQFKL